MCVRIALTISVAAAMSGCAQTGARVVVHPARVAMMERAPIARKHQIDEAREMSAALSAKRIDQWLEPPDDRIMTSLESFRIASGDAPIVVSFDDIPAGTDAEFVSEPGVTFVSHAAPLLVVSASDTWTPATYANVPDPTPYRLEATSGANILSPGGPELAPGPDPSIEDDDVTMVFDPPVAAVGFDLLMPSADGMTFTDVTVVGEDGNVLFQGRIGAERYDTGAMAFPAPGASFWGFVADGCVIREVRIDESDDNANCPDANIGIDSLRFAPAPAWRAADFDDEGRFGAADVQQFAREWQTSSKEVKSQAGWQRSDVNRDGRVDADDLLALLAATTGAAW